jgi:biopolymer transport protein ExbD
MAGSAGTEDGDMGFQIAPMVDVVFVLMVFFMAMSGMQKREKELPIALPGPVDASRAVPQILLIEISAEGEVRMNSEHLGSTGDRSLIGLRESLKVIIDQSGDRDQVVIRPSSLTRHERIIDVLNAVTAAGVKKLAFS